MIRIFNKQLVAVESGSVYVADIYCDSSDTKPTTELANGSTLTEVDTGKKYLFNEATTSWVEVSGGGGGNSNTVATYTGTSLGGVATDISAYMREKYVGITIPSGTDARDFIRSDIFYHNLSFQVILDLSNLGGGKVSLSFSQADLNFVCGAYYAYISNTVESVMTAKIDFDIVAPPNTISGITANLDYKGYMNGAVVDISQYSNLISYTLKIFWHEMPQA